ncbi:MAG: hypothetical protein LBJ62_05730 [Bifidobacteriaceae bacterium]|jgi:hypothetical protein|nr:hypothetical protein [Bifidobacteriaceae bacterium]
MATTQPNPIKRPPGALFDASKHQAAAAAKLLSALNTLSEAIAHEEAAVIAGRITGGIKYLEALEIFQPAFWGYNEAVTHWSAAYHAAVLDVLEAHTNEAIAEGRRQAALNATGDGGRADD